MTLANLRSLIAFLLLAACGAESESAAVDAAGGGEAAPLREVPCIDQSISWLMLKTEPSPAAVLSQKMGEVFETEVDATAGGMSHTQSFVYARFTPAGLEKLPVGDEDAFADDEWHIAFRRFLVRLNSGVSGPGAVTAARTKPGTTFDGLTTVPGEDELPYRTEQYFTESCDFTPDSSGQGAATALASYWSYAGCLHMTGNVFVIALPAGRHVKLEVLAYYTPESQRICDETNGLPEPSGAAHFRLRWAFLD